MSDLNIQLCPETGICSIIKADGNKLDLMPDEVALIREAAGNAAAIKQAIGEVDADFAARLGAEDVERISKKLK